MFLGARYGATKNDTVRIAGWAEPYSAVRNALRILHLK